MAALLAVFLIAAPLGSALPPVAGDDTGQTVQDTAVTINVLMGDTDPEGNPLDVTSVGVPANGTAQLNPDDTVTYTPTLGYVGDDAFTYEVCDNEPTPNCVNGNVTVDIDPRIVLADVTLTEGATPTATFSVTLSAADPTEVVTVSYATANGTALAGQDYNTTSGTLAFNPTSTTPTAPLEVPIVADSLDEPDETFVVDFSGAVEAALPTSQAVGTIVDEDPLVAISVSDATITEGNAGAAPGEVRVALNAASAKAVTVDYSTSNGSAFAPGDYHTAGGQIAFAPGETQKSVFVTVVGDTTFEPDETFVLSLGNPVNADIADGQGITTIQNNDASPTGCDITGTMGADRLTGTAANERICGLGGNDTISGGGGDDEIFGDEGNDRINGDAGGDAIEGGRGNDVLLGGGDGDALEGGSGNDNLDGGGGDDTINGEGGIDTARGGGGEDVMDAGPGNDTFAGGPANDRLEGGGGNDRLGGDQGNDFVDGSGDDDSLRGGSGNDTLLGKDGADLLEGGTGNDQLSGGGGIDHANYGSSRAAVKVDLSRGRATGDGRDRVLAVENVTGSRFGDVLTGSSVGNVLVGGGGSDTIYGRAKNDRLLGGPGDDFLRGEKGRDLLVGSSGRDNCDVGPGGLRATSC